jgi:hypothetical protein
LGKFSIKSLKSTLHYELLLWYFRLIIPNFQILKDEIDTLTCFFDGIKKKSDETLVD